MILVAQVEYANEAGETTQFEIAGWRFVQKKEKSEGLHSMTVDCLKK